MKISFIGVGNMGGPMCRNIIKNSGHDVVVFDLNSDAIARCTELGAKAASSVKEATIDADVVMTSLPHPRNVEQVVLGENGISANIKSGAIYCDLSTNSPILIRKLAAHLEKLGVSMLDAPVSGGVVLAEKGKIAIMVGGDKATFDKLVPLFESYGENVVYCGDIGNGCVAKISNNLIAFCNMAASAEGLMLGVCAGIDLEVLNQVIRNSSGNSMTFRAVAKNTISGDWTASFAIDLAYKDMHLALELADDLGVPLMLSPTVHNLMRMAKGLGYAKDDATAIMRVYEDTMNKVLKVNT